MHIFFPAIILISLTFLSPSKASDGEIGVVTTIAPIHSGALLYYREVGLSPIE